MKTILIVEDEAALAAALGILVRRLGHEPILAASAAAGLDLLAARPPALVILDIGLPDQSGIAVLQQIRARDAALPVLVITAHGNLQNAVEAKKRGASGYLVKPLDLDELERQIEGLVGEAGSAPVLTRARLDADHAPLRKKLRGRDGD